MLNFNSRLPPLRVHSWGGFGSQLNALAFTLDFLTKSSGRRVHLVIHTGGVTRRSMEIAELLPSYISWSEVNDFSHKTNTRKRKFNLRYFVSLLSKKLGFVVFPERNSDFTKIKFWTISSRGHYSYISFSENTVNMIFKIIMKSGPKSKNYENIVHYRLGDLLSVGKGFVEPYNLLQLTDSIGVKKWHVLTDSPDMAQKMFNDLSRRILINEILKLPPVLLIKTGVQSRIFIGTTSKLSIWICVFRIYLDSGVTFMPKSLRVNLVQLFEGQTPKNLDFY